jgi:hypothetical protein
MKNSNLVKRVLVAVTVSLGVVVAAWAASAINVIATINNYNGSTPYYLESDGSLSATYDGGLSPTGGGTQDYYQLDLSAGRSRSFYLTLSPVDSASAAAAPFTGRLAFTGPLYSRCFTPSLGYQTWTQIQPTTPDGNCSMRLNFTYNNVDYILVMSPEYPGTGTATVTCTNWSTSANSCLAWTDVPNPNAANPNVAFLLNKSNGEIKIGSYWLNFNLTLTEAAGKK